MLKRARNRVSLGVAFLGVLLGAALVPAPATSQEASAPTPPDPEAVLQTCLLPTPSGYVVSPQQHLPQRNPVPLTPDERTRLLFPQLPELKAKSMGWAMPDPAYLASIPEEARALPRSFATLPVLRFNNIEIHGERELRWRRFGAYDQWFLRDITRNLNAVMAIHRKTRRVYFFEYERQEGRTIFMPGKESCYACHISGPRLVRTYDLEKVDTALLEEFNRRLLSYGAANFGKSVDPERLGPALEDSRCTGCHDGKTRGRLYTMHLLSMAHYVQTLRTMPPGAPLTAEESQALLAGQYQRYRAASAPD